MNFLYVSCVYCSSLLLIFTISLYRTILTDFQCSFLILPSLQGHPDQPSSSGGSKLRRRRITSCADGPQPSGVEEKDEESAAKKPKTDKEEEGEDIPQQKLKQVKGKKKTKTVMKATEAGKEEDETKKKKVIKKTAKVGKEDDETKKKKVIKKTAKVGKKDDETKKKRKKKSQNLRCTECCLTMRRASIVRHFRRHHGLPTDARWIRTEHPEVVSQDEDNKTYVLDPADKDDKADFIDEEDPIIILKRRVERQSFKIELLQEGRKELQQQNDLLYKEVKRLQEKVETLTSENNRLKEAESSRLKEEKTQEVASEKQELASEKQEVASEKQEVASEKQEVASKKPEVATAE